MVFLNRKLVFATLTFLLSFTLIYSNSGIWLGFADAGEFALVSKIFGIAHPPGFPAYVLLGGLWGKLFGLFFTNHVQVMLLFSVFCTALACVFLYDIVEQIWEESVTKETHKGIKGALSLSIALIMASGTTVWYWSHSVEVYSLQLLSFSMLIWGLMRYSYHQKSIYVWIGSLGLAIGLANHHLTMILYLPFGLLFLLQKSNANLLNPLPLMSKLKGKKKAENNNLLQQLLKTKVLYQAIGLTVLLTLIFYGFMFWRARLPMPFKFGSPDNIERLLYHLSGGAWVKNTKQVVEGIIQMRIRYFFQLFVEQFLFAAIFIGLGIAYLIKHKRYLFVGSMLGYFITVLAYQLRIDQTSDTDAYMIMPFLAIHLFIPYGLFWFKNKLNLMTPIVLIIAAINMGLNYEKTDTRKFDVSRSIMNTLDQSSPKGSMIIMADWTTVAQYYYYRIAENFRPDLIVINYDLKFTHKDILPLMYPHLYAFIKKEYDYFIAMLLQYHPEQAYNTGCTLDNVPLSNAYRNLFFKLQQYADYQNIAFLTDPKTFVYSLQDKLLSSKSSVSGMFVSKSPQATGLGNEFLNLDYQWLQSERLFREPAAGDKLVDLEAMFDFHRNYYRSINDNQRLAQAEANYAYIKSLQKKMKEKMPFLFRPKGK